MEALQKQLKAYIEMEESRLELEEKIDKLREAMQRNLCNTRRDLQVGTSTDIRLVCSGYVARMSSGGSYDSLLAIGLTPIHGVVPSDE
jgi:hypothetical protein